MEGGGVRRRAVLLSEMKKHLIFVLIAGACATGPLEAGELVAAFAEALPEQEDAFRVYRGFPNAVSERALHESEKEKLRRALGGDGRVWRGVFSSFDEIFYMAPLELSREDEREVAGILARGRLAPVSEVTLPRWEVRQADYKITCCKGGYGYNVHVYAGTRAVVAFGNLGGGGAVRLEERDLSRLLKILRAYGSGRG